MPVIHSELKVVLSDKAPESDNMGGAVVHRPRLNLFLASSSSARLHVADKIRQVSERGHTIYNWAADPDWDEPVPCPAAARSKCLFAVDACQALIWYNPSASSHGAPFEAGYAMHARKKIVVVQNFFPDPGKIYALGFLFFRDVPTALDFLELTAGGLHEEAVKCAHDVFECPPIGTHS